MWGMGLKAMGCYETFCPTADSVFYTVSASSVGIDLSYAGYTRCVGDRQWCLPECAKVQIHGTMLRRGRCVEDARASIPFSRRIWIRSGWTKQPSALLGPRAPLMSQCSIIAVTRFSSAASTSRPYRCQANRETDLRRMTRS